MNKSLFILTTAALLSSSSYVNSVGIGVGPFDIEFNAGYNDSFGPGMRGSNKFYDPICRAISQQKKLEFIAVSKETTANEIKITTKRVVVEPYAFGFTKDNLPILRGTVTEEKLIKEVTVKFGEDNQKPNRDENKEGAVSGTFRPAKSKDNVETLNLTRVRNVRVIGDSHFDAPKDIGSIFKQDIARVVCQVPSKEE